ncbi:hypothetical protein F0562_012247 [Nyssa sinensis]|uniref:Histone acetyltransferase n=1 Tax=Nyssa sinensis TaxID=561372 RepID=A0A5J4ZUL5_9ASTE|nr:hypothetical protein F0562_012247 [Nyssa sinensis]
MPRPGPRPYECVRRAWHSDRHQPIRGSLIQEIFRVVNEIHSSATKSNKEWQEKLPIVVFKAEEIMYSKANSETEYMDLKTLWERANDAINTIIRRDGSTETGELLQPCIEAALHLGCTPGGGSRSQRNSNQRCYLSVSTTETTCVPPSNIEKTRGNHTANTHFMSHYPNFTKSGIINSIQLGSESHCPVAENNNCTTNKYPFVFENFPQHGTSQCLTMETYPSSNSCSVYPLNYGNQFQSQESQSGFGIPSKLNSHIVESAEVGVLQNLLSLDAEASNKIPQAELSNSPEKSTDIRCDLSLRLGPLSVPCISVENSWPQEVEDVGSSTSWEGSKVSELSPLMDHEFSFFPKVNADDPLDSCSSKCCFEDENMHVEATTRKQKAVVSHPSEDKRFVWQPKLPYNHLTGRMNNADSVGSRIESFQNVTESGSTATAAGKRDSCELVLFSDRKKYQLMMG